MLPELNAGNLRNGYFLFTGEVEGVVNVCVQIREVTGGFGLAVVASNVEDKMIYYNPYSDSFISIDFVPSIDTAQEIIDSSGLELTALAIKHWAPSKDGIEGKINPA